MGLHAEYRAFETGDIRRSVRMIRDKGIRGVSVTLPYKQSVIPLLDELDPEASRIGAVNTITSEGGRLRGSNTDWRGLAHEMRGRFELKGQRIAVIGAGGAARAAIYAVGSEGGLPVILCRDTTKGESLGRELGCEFVPLSDIGSVSAPGLINTTPLGMAPHTGESPVEARLLGRFDWVVDIIYNPQVTRLLEDARGKGCRTLNGIGMLVNQGAEQIRIWTGKEAPRELMREVVTERLRNGAMAKKR
jgi:shikimate dehydrogenase